MIQGEVTAGCADRSGSGPANSPPLRLALCTALAAMPGQRPGSMILTRKFLDGVREYARYWPGEITVWVARARSADSNLDHVETSPGDESFAIRWIEGDPRDAARFSPAVEGADLVLAALVDAHVALARTCRSQHVPLVYVTEYSLKTRRQIIATETRNPLLRWRRTLWTIRLERAYQAAIRLAHGVQCNGVPTHNAYRAIARRAMLYFDTRVRSAQIVEHDTLRRRLDRLRAGGPIRLAFSGRLIAMKGADHLPRVARQLRQLGVPFTLDICGGGALEPTLRTMIAQAGLNQHVRLRGVLDFERELLPFIAGEIDLFVCCHRQGDPSCTYLETYSCGVPIVGYDNEAFSGVVNASGVGDASWVTPLDNPITLAGKIADLNSRREDLAAASENARAFAANQTFEHTMRRRVEHMLECMTASRT